MNRIGLGTDSHAFEKNPTSRPLMLGGIAIPNHSALVGDSDADVLLHALFNALTSAAGDRGLGKYFSKADMDKGYSDSSKILEKGVEIIRTLGFRIENVSVALECKTPKIEPHVPAMKARVAEILGISGDAVGITATSGDGMSPYAKGEGIYCQAIALLSKK